MLSLISRLSSSTTPLTMSAIAEALGTLDIMRLEISANEGGFADVPECFQTGQNHCISLTVDIFVKSSYSGMDMFMNSIDSHFSHPSHDTALDFGSKPCFQPAQKSKDFFGLDNFRLRSRLGAMSVTQLFGFTLLSVFFISFLVFGWRKKIATRMKMQRI